MPAPHRRMVEDMRAAIGRSGSVRAYIERRRNGTATSDANDAVAVAYYGCVRAMHAFRTLHLSVATRYLIKTKLGTGTSTFRDMLRDMKNSTIACCGGASRGSNSASGGVRLAATTKSD